MKSKSVVILVAALASVVTVGLLAIGVPAALAWQGGEPQGDCVITPGVSAVCTNETTGCEQVYEWDEGIGNYVLVSSTGDCSGGGGGDASAEKASNAPYYDAYVGLLPPEETYGPLSLPSPNGVYACGVFDTRGHGPKVILLSDFPNCTGTNLTVLCLNGAGEWTGETVSNVHFENNGNELRFTSSQHGTCGIFSTR